MVEFNADKLNQLGRDKQFIAKQYIPAPIKLTGVIQNLIERAKVDISVEIQPPPVALEVNGRIFGTLGSFSLVTGKAKSKKTFCVTLAMAAALNRATPNTFIGRLPPEKNKVVYFDTEQARYQVVDVAKRVCQLTKTDFPDNFDVYCLRSLSATERLKVIDTLLSNASDIGLVVIDGVRDLLNSFNSVEDSAEVINHLLRWTEEKQLHIILVLHQNKNDTFARGHLGSELVNKSETTISVTKHEGLSDISIVKPEFSKYIEIEPFAFQINDQGLPEPLQDFIVRGDYTGRERKKPRPNDFTDDDHRNILENLRTNHGDILNRRDLETAIKSVFESVTGISIGVVIAKQYLNFYKERGNITQTGTPNTRNSRYHIHPEVKSKPS